MSRDVETVVVENSPTREGAAIVEREFNNVRLIENGRNAGFAGGHNLAYATTDSPYFCVLNPDVIPLAGSVERLIMTLEERPNAAIVGPCLLNTDGSVQHSARRFFDWPTVLARRLPVRNAARLNERHLLKDCDLSYTQRVDWVLGAALLVRRAAFPDSALFDQRYHLYFEDVDLCYFAHQRGWEVVYCPDSRMIHDHQRESARGLNRKLVIHLMSWLKFTRKRKLYWS